MTRRGSLQQRKGDGEVQIEISQLRNEEGMIGMLELPKMSLGDIKADLKLKQGTIHFNEFTIRSSDLTGEVTGSVGIRSALSRFSVKSHISLELSPEFVKNTPDIKKIAMLQRKFFKPKGAGYHVGIDLRGAASRLRPSAREYSPYSKEGRAQQREQRATPRAAQRVKSSGASRPKSPVRQKGLGAKRRPARRPASPSAQSPREPRKGLGGFKPRRGLKDRSDVSPFAPSIADETEEELEPSGGAPVELDDETGEEEVEDAGAEGQEDKQGGQPDESEEGD